MEMIDIVYNTWFQNRREGVQDETWLHLTPIWKCGHGRLGLGTEETGMNCLAWLFIQAQVQFLEYNNVF